jgi:hypothetical protein
MFTKVVKEDLNYNNKAIYADDIVTLGDIFQEVQEKMSKWDETSRDIEERSKF